MLLKKSLWFLLSWGTLLGINLSCQSEIDSAVSPPPQIPTALIEEGNNLERNIFVEKGNTNSVDTNKFTWVLDSSFYTQPDVLLRKLDSIYQLPYQNNELVARKSYILDGLEQLVYFLAVKTTTAIKPKCAISKKNTYFLFDQKGQLLWKKQLIEADLLPMLKDSVATLMTVEINCEGEGKHHLYQYQNGEFIDVLNALSSQVDKTFDANPKGGMFYRNQLQYSILDVNEDGALDFVLKGRWLVLENEKGRQYTPQYPYKINPIEYAYCYIPAKESFLLEK
jgi:hypothetical protein